VGKHHVIPTAKCIPAEIVKLHSQLHEQQKPEHEPSNQQKKKIPSALLYMDGVPDELTENLP
jgi:hypothetical protein